MSLRKIIFLTLFTFSACVNSVELKFITLEVAPWAYYDYEENSYAGIFSDVVTEIERRTGFTIKIVLSSFGFSRINRELGAGRQDCTMVILQEERKDMVVLGETLFDHSMGVIAKKGVRLNQYEDLYDLTISVHEVLSVEGQFMDDKRLNKEFDVDYSAGLRKIQHGRLDAIAGAISTIEYLARKNGMAGVLGKPLVLNQEPIYLQCSTKSKKLQYIDGVNKAIRSIKKDGTLEKIINRNS
jgi:polar amino acid transport system substrate-binding protein